MSDQSLTSDELAHLASNLMAAKMYSLASCVMLYYDICITMKDEVERIWLQPKYTIVTILFALNRYLTPLIYVVIIVSFHMPWPIDVCDRYILYPEATKVVTCAIIGVIFILRVHAIYGRSKKVTALTSAALVAELAIKIYAFTDGTRLHLPDGIVGCILVGTNNTRYVFSWIAELGFDTLVFVMTMWRTWVLYRQQGARPMSLLSLVIRDGVIYFIVIFLANLATVLLFLTAPPDIKAFNASFSTIITTLMVSRLILNLKGASGTAFAGTGHVPDTTNKGGAVADSYIDFSSDAKRGHRVRPSNQLPNDVLRYELGRIARK